MNKLKIKINKWEKCSIYDDITLKFLLDKYSIPNLIFFLHIQRLNFF